MTNIEEYPGIYREEQTIKKITKTVMEYNKVFFKKMLTE